MGLGTGWFEQEHTAYGIPFPPLGERFERLEEQLEIISGLWSTPAGERYSFSGKHYELKDSPALPKPEQQPPPIVIGGGGPRKTPRLAAAYAAEYNLPFAPPEAAAKQFDNVRRACDDAGRDPASLVLSAAVVLCCGENDKEVDRRAAAIGRKPDELRQNGAAGTPDEVIDKLKAYAAVGADVVYLQVLDLDDLDHLRLVAGEVAPAL